MYSQNNLFLTAYIVSSIERQAMTRYYLQTKKEKETQKRKVEAAAAAEAEAEYVLTKNKLKLLEEEPSHC